MRKFDVVHENLQGFLCRRRRNGGEQEGEEGKSEQHCWVRLVSRQARNFLIEITVRSVQGQVESTSSVIDPSGRRTDKKMQSGEKIEFGTYLEGALLNLGWIVGNCWRSA